MTTWRKSNEDENRQRKRDIRRPRRYLKSCFAREMKPMAELTWEIQAVLEEYTPHQEQQLTP